MFNKQRQTSVLLYSHSSITRTGKILMVSVSLQQLDLEVGVEGQRP